MRSFSHGSYAAQGAIQGEILRASEICPLTSYRRGTDSPAMGKIQGTGTKRLVDSQHPREPSLWNDSAFDTAAFVDHFFFVPRSFHDDF